MSGKSPPWSILPSGELTSQGGRDPGKTEEGRGFLVKGGGTPAPPPVGHQVLASVLVSFLLPLSRQPCVRLFPFPSALSQCPSIKFFKNVEWPRPPMGYNFSEVCHWLYVNIWTPGLALCGSYCFSFFYHLGPTPLTPHHPSTITSGTPAGGKWGPSFNSSPQSHLFGDCLPCFLHLLSVHLVGPA